MKRSISILGFICMSILSLSAKLYADEHTCADTLEKVLDEIQEEFERPMEEEVWIDLYFWS